MQYKCKGALCHFNIHCSFVYGRNGHGIANCLGNNNKNFKKNGMRIMYPETIVAVLHMKNTK